MTVIGEPCLRTVSLLLGSQFLLSIHARPLEGDVRSDLFPYLERQIKVRGRNNEDLGSTESKSIIWQHKAWEAALPRQLILINQRLDDIESAHTCDRPGLALPYSAPLQSL